MSAVIVLHDRRRWTCPHCGQEHRVDHDLHDLVNLECDNCERVTLGRLVADG